MVLAVADASVVAKWFLEEAFSEEARILRDDFLEGRVRLRVPSLLPFEVLNALRFNANFPLRNLLEAGRALDRAGLVTVPLAGDYLERTVLAAGRHQLTVYDASYLALAELMECLLFSADDEMVRLGLREPRIVHVRDYPVER